MNNEKDVPTDHWWLKLSQIISKYVLSYYFYIHIVLLISIAILELRFSVVYKDDCTIDDRIILYLFLIGIFQIIYSSNGILLIIFSFLYEKYPCLIRFLCIDFLIHQILLVFLIIWFIIGNYLVFHIKNQVQSINSYSTSTYCDYTLYQTAFWITITYYILIVLFIIILILTHLIKQCKSSKNKIIV